MEQTLSWLIGHISSHMPQLSMVDEDYGQLENLDNDSEDMYPLTFPAVLVEEQQTEWSDIGDLEQRGTCTLRVRLVIDCYDDTHAHSGTEQAVAQRDDMRHRLHELLQGTCPCGGAPMMRKASRFFTWKHGIKVYEMTYECTLAEDVTERATVRKPAVRVRT